MRWLSQTLENLQYYSPILAISVLLDVKDAKLMSAHSGDSSRAGDLSSVTYATLLQKFLSIISK